MLEGKAELPKVKVDCPSIPVKGLPSLFPNEKLRLGVLIDSCPPTMDWLVLAKGLLSQDDPPKEKVAEGVLALSLVFDVVLLAEEKENPLLKGLLPELEVTKEKLGVFFSVSEFILEVESSISTLGAEGGLSVCEMEEAALPNVTPELKVEGIEKETFWSWLPN